MTTYTAAPTDHGDWCTLADGRQMGGYIYTQARAEVVAGRLNDLERLNEAIEKAIGQTRHYGIVVTSGPSRFPGSQYPSWYITDPAGGLVDYAFAHYAHTPPAVDVYTREQYETACAAVGITPAADTDLGTYADEHFQINYMEHEAPVVIEHTLRGRRLGGLRRERAAADAAALDKATAAVPGESYTREQYEQACAAAGIEPASDRQCSDIDNTEYALGGRTAAGALATRRVNGVDAEATYRTCANPRCHRQYRAGTGMVASLGMVCGVDCYDAMSG